MAPPREPAKFLADSNSGRKFFNPGESHTKGEARMVLNTFVSVQEADSRSLSGQLRHEQSCSYVDLLNEPRIEIDAKIEPGQFESRYPTEVNQRFICTSEQNDHLCVQLGKRDLQEVEEDLAIEDSAAIQAFFSLEPRTRGQKSMQLPDDYKPGSACSFGHPVKEKYKSMRQAVLKSHRGITDRFASLPLMREL